MAKDKRGKGKQPAEADVADGIWTAVADKTQMVAAAVANQLHHEGHWPPNDLTKVMGADYHYDQFSIVNFLNAVRWNLAHGSPSYAFTFTGEFAGKALTAQVGTLMVAVNASTR